MAFFNYVTKEITLKVVYYGPGLSGKTTNLQHLHQILDPSHRGKFISLATESDRTLFFDFLPIDLGKIKDFTVRFQLYTVPGQIRYNATRKLVLKGADAVVFVADSQSDMRDQNKESFDNMKENLIANGIDPAETPIVIQYNKRDLPNILSVAELRNDLNTDKHQDIEAVAAKGTGVQETFRCVTKMLLKDISRRYQVDLSSAREEKPPLLSAGPVEQKPREMPLPQQTSQAAQLRDMILPSTQPEAPSKETATTPPLSGLTDTVNEMKQSIAGIRETLSVLGAEMREMRGQRAELTRLIRELNNLLNAPQQKKRWFFFNRRQ